MQLQGIFYRDSKHFQEKNSSIDVAFDNIFYLLMYPTLLANSYLIIKSEI